PAPAEERTWLHGFPGAEAALAAAMALRDSAVVVSRLQLVDRSTLLGLGHTGATAAALAVTVGGVGEAVRAHGGEIDQMGRRGGGAPLSAGGRSDWWTAVSDSAWPTEPETTLALRIGTRPADVVKALRGVEVAAGDEVGCRASAEVANGVLHAVLTGVSAA